MKLHRSITTRRVNKLAEESLLGTSDMGICIVCGESVPAEIDAEKLICSECDEPAVYGPGRLLTFVL